MISWRRARPTDIPACVGMAQADFEREIQGHLAPNPWHYSHELNRAVVDQFYNPLSQYLTVHEGASGVDAYTWCHLERTPWSPDWITTVRVAHVSLALPARSRVRLVHEMIEQWQSWAIATGSNRVWSTTIRQDWSTFMRLHESHGFEVRGSMAIWQLNKAVK